MCSCAEDEGYEVVVLRISRHPRTVGGVRHHLGDQHDAGDEAVELCSGAPSEESVPAQHLLQLVHESWARHDPNRPDSSQVHKSAANPIGDRRRDEDVRIEDQPQRLLLRRVVHL